MKLDAFDECNDSSFYSDMNLNHSIDFSLFADVKTSHSQ